MAPTGAIFYCLNFILFKSINDFGAYLTLAMVKSLEGKKSCYTKYNRY